mgnify:CR=1 FL=1
MCLARNMKNRAKRERKRDKLRAATIDYHRAVEEVIDSNLCAHSSSASDEVQGERDNARLAYVQRWTSSDN